MSTQMTRNDIIDFMELYRATLREEQQREVVDGLIEFMQLKFRQHVLEYRYAEQERRAESFKAL